VFNFMNRHHHSLLTEGGKFLELELPLQPGIRSIFMLKKKIHIERRREENLEAK
jgi:hypothetical protein